MITDVEFVGQLDSEIGEEYLRATEFISVMPDYAFLCLRKAGEALCRELANQNDVSLEKLKLKKRINLLFRRGVLDEQSKDALHQVCMLCNAGVHKNDAVPAESGGNQHEGTSVDNKQKQVGRVKKARECFLFVA